ncbi:MAG: hypothetical protein LDL11_01465 [Desulfarculus sp.]|nr:hypothetical protein [Desulfarculus sp.]
MKRAKRLALWPVLLLAVCLCWLGGPAAASSGAVYRLDGAAVLDASAGATRDELGAAYQGVDAAAYHLSLYDGDLVAANSQSASGGSSAAAAGSATYWWYITLTDYRVLMPGTSVGPYSAYYQFALGLSGYLPSAYASARAVLGVGNDGYGKINLWLDYASGDNSAGWYYMGRGYNDITLNLWTSGTYAYFGSVASHETTHLILDHKTDLYNRAGVASSWVTEALAWYVQETVYPYGDRNGYAYNAALLNYYSQNGKQRADWYSSGGRYNGWIAGQATSLDYVQMQTIGYFLANSSRGWSAIHDTVGYLASGLDIDGAFARAYGGLTTGMHSTASGEGVNTLYSKYLNYYLGHY